MSRENSHAVTEARARLIPLECLSDFFQGLIDLPVCNVERRKKANDALTRRNRKQAAGHKSLNEGDRDIRLPG